MSLKIAHISDPHFGTVKPEVLAALKTSLEELAPSLIVVSGDITQRARAKQFRAAREFMVGLKPTPMIIIPGNHDIPLYNLPVRALSPYWGFRRILKGHLDREVILNGVQVLAFNSTGRFRLVQGRLNLRKVKKVLGVRKPEVKVRIATFHHPMSCPKRVDVKNILRGHCEAMKVFEEHKVDLILGGHIHDPYVSLSSDTYPDVKRSAIIGVAGTCLSWRTRADAPNSFNWIEIDPEGPHGPCLSISRYDLQKDLRFRSIMKEEFIRQKESGWQRSNFPIREVFDPGTPEA